MKILVADDEENLGEVMSAFLDTLQHQADIVHTGVQAMNAVHGKKYDLVFLDVKMPDIEGTEILRSLSGLDDAPLVVILTGNATVEGAAQAVKDGAFEYLIKPVNFQKVANTIERAKRVLTLKEENRSYRENLEKLVAEKTDELLSRNRELKQTCTRLEEALKGAERASRLAALGQLASGVVHEIRNPLSGILLAVFNIREEAKNNPVILDYLHDVEKTINNMSKTLERLLNFARPPAPSLERANLTDVCVRALKLSQNYLEKNHINIIRELDFDLPSTQLDSAQCEQIMVNLIINAANAMPDGGELVISTWKEEGRICAAAADTGCGVPQDMREKIFSPFFSNFANGTGLGLPISRSLAESHGGDLYLDDTTSNIRGSRFVLVLPMVESSVSR